MSVILSSSAAMRTDAKHSVTWKIWNQSGTNQRTTPKTFIQTNLDYLKSKKTKWTDSDDENKLRVKHYTKRKENALIEMPLLLLLLLYSLYRNEIPLLLLHNCRVLALNEPRAAATWPKQNTDSINWKSRAWMSVLPARIIRAVVLVKPTRLPVHDSDY